VPKGDLSTSALIFALQTTFDADAADGLRAGIALTIDGEPFRVEVARKKLSITRGDDARADATIETTARALRAVVFGIKALREVERDLVIGGDAALAKQFLALFRRPT